MLRALMKKDYQIENVFLKPVDTTELPDYPSVIKQPICISDIMCVCAQPLQFVLTADGSIVYPLLTMREMLTPAGSIFYAFLDCSASEV